MSLILRAARYAEEKHKGQKRKYSGKPYITHPARVAAKATVYFAATSDWSPSRGEEVVGAAWCHDVSEDCFDIPEEGFEDMLIKGFPAGMVNLCRELTNPSKGSKAPRKVRKQMDRDHLKTVSHEAQIIKLIDRDDNVEEMWEAPLDFIELYGKETKRLVEVLRPADEKLADQVLATLAKTMDIAESWQRGRID